MMDELLEQFLIEGRELVAQASRDLAVPGSDGKAALPPAIIDSAFRAIHTLKGSFAIFAMAPAERLLHAAEDVLDRARKDVSLLEPAQIAALVACVDQVDRWLDEIESTGALPADAEDVAGRTAAGLVVVPPASKAPPERAPVSMPMLAYSAGEWLAALKVREAAALANADSPLVAFRYTPDANCFFRGEDPLATARAVPGLIALAVLPAARDWPAPETMEPFGCISVLEGVSTAPDDAVRNAFRLQPEQVLFATIDADSAEQRPAAPLPESGLLRVEASRLEAMANSLGDLVVAINALTPLGLDLQRSDPVLAARMRAAHVAVERTAVRLQRDLAAVRLVPLEPTLRRLPRLAREIAESLGKAVTLTMSGTNVQVDKQIADALFEPLLHLVRNAIDHGIEEQDQRRGRDKPAAGQVSLAFRREGSRIVAAVKDDGRGMDATLIREAAVARGLIAGDAAASLTDTQARRLIFLPGFSTAAAVTEVSGRGVGMDAVRIAVEKLRGSIDIESEPDQGTTFTLRLPISALTTQLLVVVAGGTRYGVPLDHVVETVRVTSDALMPVGTGTACVLRDRTVPVLDLAQLLGGDGRQGEASKLGAAKLVVIHAAGERVAMRVDDFAERIDTVLRPADGILASAHGIAGTALTGDGDVLVVLDLPELAA